MRNPSDCRHRGCSCGGGSGGLDCSYGECVGVEIMRTGIVYFFWETGFNPLGGNMAGVDGW